MVLAIILVLAFEINLGFVGVFSMNADLCDKRDWITFIACCFLPIIPIGYAYRWCDRFVRGM
jgi:hypothetical protein